MTNDGFSDSVFAIILILGRCSDMITRINYEVLSPAMKAKLDPTYRRVLRAEKHPQSARFWKNANQINHETVLPFTTVTRAYGTYQRSV